MSQPSNLGDGFPRGFAQFNQCVFWSGRIRAHGTARPIDAERNAGEIRPDAVVKVAPNAPALFLTCAYELLTRAAEVAVEDLLVGGNRDVAGEFVQQTSIGSSKSVLRSTGSDTAVTPGALPKHKGQLIDVPIS